MKSLYLVGAGGHSRSCIDVIEQMGVYHIKGLFDLPEKVGEDFCGYKILASDHEVAKYIDVDNYFLITIGQIKTSLMRQSIFMKLKDHRAQFATIVSPRAYIAKKTQIGEGTIIMHDVLVNTKASVGSNCIINSKALIEHDAQVGDHCHISTGAIINGGAVVREIGRAHV